MEIEIGAHIREADNTQHKELDQNIMLESWGEKKTKEPRGGQGKVRREKCDRLVRKIKKIYSAIERTE